MKRNISKKTKNRALQWILILLFVVCVLAANYFLGGGSRTAGSQAGNDQVMAGEGPSGLEIHFIDVGQGDATLIKADGHAMLIDSG